MPIWTLSPFKLLILRIWFVAILKGGQPSLVPSLFIAHAEKESGETRIQFWFHTYVTYTDTGTMNVIISDGAITVY